MTTFETLAENAYKAFVKQAEPTMKALRDAHWEYPPPLWGQLAPEVQECWLAVARHMVAEMAALH